MSLDYQRTYLFSDTYGGRRRQDGAPLGPLERPDLDVQLETDFGSAEALGPVHLREDVYGLPAAHVRHLVRLALNLQAEHGAPVGRTGIFYNAAPRLTPGGEPAAFYVADAVPGGSEGSLARIVTTDLDILAGSERHLTRLRTLPTRDNLLHENGDQFRSRLTPGLLSELVASGARLAEVTDPTIPGLPEGWRVRWVDAFGNILTEAVGPDAQAQVAAILARQKPVNLRLGAAKQGCLVKATDGLESSGPGDLSLYPNGNIDLVRRWGWGAARFGSGGSRDTPGSLPEENPQTRIYHSAYNSFGRPRLDDKVQVVEDVARSASCVGSRFC
ncbi:hypothetical protein CO046_03850 [Candidatus Peregrinibacteria bacterium CG_4_9_14_0_2_um_filter_53_11]|nr:MAG: hypothetical protein CO046_03850 [Candidatus Peregrinibacteria bacterium CG_4_9_14_0_2_um_filter_53_11]